MMSRVMITVPGEVLSAIDAEVKRQRAERPGVYFTRSEAIREALYLAPFLQPVAKAIPTNVRPQPATVGG